MRAIWLPTLLGLAFVTVTGCSTSRPVATIPGDLPAIPDTCATYCREDVPPVYRKAPRLVQIRPGYMKETPYQVKETRYDEVMVSPRKTVRRELCGQTCEQSIVQMTPGGYKWVQKDDGCWKYEYCRPDFKWCNRRVSEDGIEYCTETPPEFKTVKRERTVTKMRREYVPAEYGVRYVDELYTPGHTQWRGKYTCDCTNSCDCRKVKPKTTVIMESCERCN